MFHKNCQFTHSDQKTYRGPCVGMYNNIIHSTLCYMYILVHEYHSFAVAFLIGLHVFLIRLPNYMYTEKLTELACISYMINIVHVSPLKVRAHTTSILLVKRVNLSKSKHPFLANVVVMEPNCTVHKLSRTVQEANCTVPKADQTEPCYLCSVRVFSEILNKGLNRTLSFAFSVYYIRRSFRR